MLKRERLARKGTYYIYFADYTGSCWLELIIYDTLYLPSTFIFLIFFPCKGIKENWIDNVIKAL